MEQALAVTETPSLLCLLRDSVVTVDLPQVGALGSGLFGYLEAWQTLNSAVRVCALFDFCLCLFILENIFEVTFNVKVLLHPFKFVY